MMNSYLLSVVTFLIVAPAISNCDKDLSKTEESSERSQQEFDYKNENAINDPWSFYRSLRAPSGFQGVRGKRLLSVVDDFPSETKRAPSQAFFGMRGKKYFDGKRAPASFYGVRGKKSSHDDGDSSEDLQALLYRDLQEERERIANFMEDYMDEKDKRRPSGFVGLRGKKSMSYDDDLEFEKRMPMGFQGVRGKKDEYTNFIESGEKRAPAAGFFGMRGKKQPTGYQSSSNFFGVRKKPYMPYGKFVGVRGKKSQDKMLRLEGNEQSDALRPAARVSGDSTQDKRLGFIGMRG